MRIRGPLTALAGAAALAAAVLAPAAAPAVRAAPLQIAFSSSDESVLSLGTTAGNDAQPIYQSDGTTSIVALSIAPDGSNVLALSNTDQFQLALVPIDGRHSRPDRRHRRRRHGLLLAGRQVHPLLDRPEHVRHADARDLLRRRLRRDAEAARLVAGRLDRLGPAALAERHAARVRPGHDRLRRHRDGHARGHAGRRRRRDGARRLARPDARSAASASPSRPTARRSPTWATRARAPRASSPSPWPAARRRSSRRTRTTGRSSPRTGRRSSSRATRSARTRTTAPSRRSTRSTTTWTSSGR